MKTNNIPYAHIPVMLKEVIDYLNPQPGQNFIDCTLGGCGYTLAISEKIGKDGKVIAIDADALAIKNAKRIIQEKKIKNIILIQENFRNILKITNELIKEKKITKINGIVYDLGLSSAQLEDRSRGFAFKVDGPLNMAFGNSSDVLSTEYIINNFKEKELKEILWQYGEERFSKNIVRSIISHRKTKPITTTKQLVEIISSAVPNKYKNKKIHFATKTFQAFRIATNNELEALKASLRDAVNLLARGGRIVAVSYHSLEDRIIKNFFKEESRFCVCPPQAPVCTCHHIPLLNILTKKPITPTLEEISINNRARSAKLRAAIKNNDLN